MAVFIRLFFTCCLISSVIWLTSARKCKQNEVKADCFDKCQTCQYKDGGCIQTEECIVDKCNCIDGYFRNSKGDCVPKSECDDKECGKNEQYYPGCIPTCNNTCENYGRKGPCPLFCMSGCACKPGYVKLNNKKCVKPENCDTCGRNEVNSTCVNPCNDCVTRGKCQFLVCNKGCDCRPGYRRNEKQICIPESQCPNNECGKNEKIVSCAKPKWCNTCEIRGDCKLSSCTKGCDCKRGYYRDEDGVCIPESQCPDD